MPTIPNVSLARRLRPLLTLSTGCALLLPARNWAAESATRFAQPVQAVAAGGTLSMLRVCAALLLVLGLVFGASWLLRRVRVFGGGPAPTLGVVAQISLGARERAVVLRVGERQVLLGVAAGNVRLLTELSSNVAVTGEPPTTGTGPVAPSFSQLLRRSMGL